MANIGKLNVVLTAQTGLYDAAMKKAGATAKATAGAIQGTLKTVGTGGIQKFAGTLTSNFEAMLSPLSYAMSLLRGWSASAASGGTGALALAAALQLILIPLGLIAATLAVSRERFKYIKELGDSAARSGTEISQFQLMVQVLGGSVESAEKVMFMFNRKLGELSTQAPDAINAFSRIGLKAEDLTKLAPAAAFRKIIEGLQKVSSSANRAAIATEIFKRSGRDALGIVSKGGTAFIDKQAALIDRFGLAVDDASYKSIKAVMAAEKTISLFREGITNQIALGVAPILAELADQLTMIDLKSSGISENTVQAGQSIGFVTAILIEGGKLLGFIVGVLVFSMNGLIYGARSFLGIVISGLKQLAEATGYKSMAKKLEASAEAVRKAQEKTRANIERNFDTLGDLAYGFGSSFAANTKFFDNVRKRMDKLAEQAKTDNVFDILARNAERAGKIIEANISDPFGAFLKSTRETIALINDRVKAPPSGIIGRLGDALSFLPGAPPPTRPEDVGKNIFDILGKPGAGLQALGTEFQKLTQGRNQPGFAGAAQIGSLEAYKAIIASRQDPQLDVLNTIREIQRERLELEKKQVETGKQVLEALEELAEELGTL